MPIDLTKLTEPGYLDSFLLAQIEEDWNALVREKFKESSPPDLETMKTIWVHGFNRGGEASAKFLEELKKTIATKAP